MTMLFTGGLPETRCGGGSTLATTEHIRAVLPGLLRDIGARTLLDAPCGDLNWVSTVDLGVKYIGVDYDPTHLAGKSGFLLVRDIITDDLPKADLMLCRDFYQHWPNRFVFRALENFLRSGIPWLLATSHANSVNDDIDKSGGFRALNLRSAPFNLPEPKWQTDDPPGSKRILGLWHADAIRNGLHSS